VSKTLDEQLAELCGKSCEVKNGNTYIFEQYRVRDNVCGFKEVKWHPISDLNQLKMCYEALSEDEKAFVQIKFAVPFSDLTNKWPSDRDNLFAIFKHPELVAQAILKAKGVS